MTDDLTVRLERALGTQEQHEGDVQPDAATLAGIRAAVARGRRGRATQHAAVAAAVAAVVGVAGWFGLQERTAPLPAHTPTPSPTVTPTLSPTPTPTSTPDAQASAPALEPVSLPGMPPMYRAPEGILEQAGPGWYLVRYGSPLYEPVPGDGERQSIVVAAPTGELYHLVDLAPPFASLVRWSAPGAARVVTTHEGRPGSHAATVDLLTGEVVIDDRVPVDAEWLGMAGPDEIWLSAAAWDGSTGGTLHVVPPDGPTRDLATSLRSASVSPDGRTVAGIGGHGAGQPAEVVDLATGRRTTPRTPPGQLCDVVAWLDTTGVMASCVDRPPDDHRERWNLDEHGGQVVRIDTAGGPVEVLTALHADGVAPWAGERVRDGVVVATAAPQLSGTPDACYDFCFGGAYLWSGGDVRPVTSVDLGDDVCEVRAGSSGLLLRTGTLCYEESGRNQWWHVDEATGAARLVAPAVDSELGIDAFALVEHP